MKAEKFEKLGWENTAPKASSLHDFPPSVLVKKIFLGVSRYDLHMLCFPFLLPSPSVLKRQGAIPEKTICPEREIPD